MDDHAVGRNGERGRALGSARRWGSGVVRGLAAGLSAAVLAVTAYGWSTAGSFDAGFLRSKAIESDAPHSLGGDLNILLIGLDTRRDQHGDALPGEILDQLHAGDGDEGGYNANTLILVHIPAAMDRIVAVSVPRDNYVPVSGIPGYTHAKIKEAYGLKKQAVQEQLIARGVTDRRRLEQAGREAGRASIVRAVRDLTGVPIDRFAEVTLAGFYDLAAALGGVEVCLNNPVRDLEFSGADFPAGRQHLDPAQALAFVRQRHGLEHGDLDRTHRQQAFLTSVARQLRGAGTLTDPAKLARLMDVAHRNIVLSDGWDMTEFVRTLGTASDPRLEFRTLPILRYDVINGQDVNIVDRVAIRREVAIAFGTAAPTTTRPAPAPADTTAPADARAPADTTAPTDRRAPADTTAPVGTRTPIDTSAPITTTAPADPRTQIATPHARRTLPTTAQGTPDAGEPVRTDLTSGGIPCVD
ncbi:LCP family protein [Nocardia rhizosphaerae]|uniref:LCP family protein n=1 Tax=Nocardia rhizosphaerae TaxID=1691571 RepID=A0ABV8LB00_9NOCA